MTDRCHYCGLTGPEITDRDGKTSAFRDWFRPYGPGGALICHPCASSTPEREAATKGAMGAVMEATSIIGGGVTTIGVDGLAPGFVCPACGWELGDTPPGCPTCRAVRDALEEP